MLTIDRSDIDFTLVRSGRFLWSRGRDQTEKGRAWPSKVSVIRGRSGTDEKPMDEDRGGRAHRTGSYRQLHGTGRGPHEHWRVAKHAVQNEPEPGDPSRDD